MFGTELVLRGKGADELQFLLGKTFDMFVGVGANDGICKGQAAGAIGGPDPNENILGSPFPVGYHQESTGIVKGVGAMTIYNMTAENRTVGPLH